MVFFKRKSAEQKLIDLINKNLNRDFCCALTDHGVNLVHNLIGKVDPDRIFLIILMNKTACFIVSSSPAESALAHGLIEYVLAAIEDLRGSLTPEKMQFDLDNIHKHLMPLTDGTDEQRIAYAKSYLDSIFDNAEMTSAI